MRSERPNLLTAQRKPERTRGGREGLGESPFHPVVNKGGVSGTRVRKRANQLFSLQNALVHMHRRVRPVSLFPRTRRATYTRVHAPACRDGDRPGYRENTRARLDKEIPVARVARASSRKLAREVRELIITKTCRPSLSPLKYVFRGRDAEGSDGGERRARRSVRYAPKSPAQAGFTGVIFLAEAAKRPPYPRATVSCARYDFIYDCPARFFPNRNLGVALINPLEHRVLSP